MEIISQTLVVVDRPNPETGELEILMGVQKRGEWDNSFNFPGGKAEGTEPLPVAAARELREETGIHISPDRLSRLGNLIIDDFRPLKRRFGTVAIFGAHLSDDPPLTPKADEFDCFWVNPTDRNILLSMPRDVGRWLPLVYTEPFRPFVCLRTVDSGGGDWYETGIHLSGQQYEPVAGFAHNL